MAQPGRNKFEDAAVEDFPASVVAQVNMWGGVGLLTMLGPVGTGKTHLAHAIHNARGGTFYKTAALVLELQGSVSEFGMEETRKFLLTLCRDAKPLYLDDLGTEKMTDWVHQAFVLLVSEREEYNLPTVITSNLTGKEIADSIDRRIASRIGGGHVVKVLGHDRRKA